MSRGRINGPSLVPARMKEYNRRNAVSVPDWFIQELAEEERPRALDGSMFIRGASAIFVCPIHGEYPQLVCDKIRWSDGSRKRGCPTCGRSARARKNTEKWRRQRRRSSAEKDIEAYLICKGISVEHKETKNKPCEGWELDIYMPDLHLGIEFDGAGHTESFDEATYRQSSIEPYQKYQGFHKQKDEVFKAVGITVLHINSIEFYSDRTEVYNKIQKFVEGTYTGELIDTSSSVYGNIIY